MLRGSSDLPEGLTHRAGTCPLPKQRTSSLFGLAPCGVCPARNIAAAAVRSYRTFSPLPLSGRYIFCGTFRRALPSIRARVPSRTLSGTLLCGVRTFLSRVRKRWERPSGPAAYAIIIRCGCSRDPARVGPSPTTFASEVGFRLINLNSLARPRTRAGQQEPA